MRKLTVFNSVSLDGFFTDAKSDLSWAHEAGADPEYGAWIAENAQSGGGALVFGRKTYDMMVSYWPTPQAKQDMPEVAEALKSRPQDCVLAPHGQGGVGEHDPHQGRPHRLREEAQGRRRRRPRGHGGAASIVVQLASADSIDSYTLPVIPVVLGRGRTMFEGVERRFALKLTGTRSFKNGIVVLSYGR